MFENDGHRDEAQHDAADFRRELFDEARSDLIEAVTRAADEEELKARLFYVRAQRDALLKAAQATQMFFAVGGLVTRADVDKWRALTGSADFTSSGLHAFVTAQMAVAGVTP